MIIKLMSLMSILLLMTGCYWRNECLVTPQQVNCYYKNDYKAIQGFQKKETIGYTNESQRETDLKSCGVMDLMNGNLDLNVVYPNTTFEQTNERSKQVYNCMEKKGYIIHGYTYCMNQGKPTGFCN